MNFKLTEEHLAVQQAARDFAQNVCKPGVIERDRDQIWPAEQVKQLGELGFMGMMVDRLWAGGGQESISYTWGMEEISRVEASSGVVMSVNNSLVCYLLEKFGSDFLKEK